MNKRRNHISPLKVKNLRSGEIHDARMVNYSKGGLYFESDGIFINGSKNFIYIENSPYNHPTGGLLEYFYGEVRWITVLIESSFNYGYGIQLISGSKREDVEYSDAKGKDLRDHRREPYIQSVRFGTNKGLYVGTTKDISESGVFITSEEKFEVGQLLKLHTPLKNGNSKVSKGQIVWKNEEGFGLKFQQVK